MPLARAEEWPEGKDCRDELIIIGSDVQVLLDASQPHRALKLGRREPASFFIATVTTPV
jgi:hypothetical protein